jgi:predicted TIM-barrel fold metal-dependent hydrolase
VRNGYRIIDTDTHVGPSLEVLDEYAGERLRARRDELKPYERQTRDGTGLSISPYPYSRAMGERPDAGESATAGGKPALAGKVASKVRQPAQPEVSNRNSAGRLADMDREGRDVDLIIPGTFAVAVSAIEPDLALEVYDAYHRYIADYCSADPDRLKATILAPSWDPEWAAKEIGRLESEPWLGAVTVVLAEGTPVDDPSLHPIWAAVDGANLPLLHHSFFYEPPYFPGYRDIWGHVAVARAAAHPWGAERLLGYLLLSGLFDQYPRLRIGFAECSAGWLPSWLVRLEGQADYLAPSLPERARTPLEYAKDGRVFCGLDLYEGEAIVRSIMAVIGDEAIMYQSDYPHDQCLFPESPDDLLSWEKSLGRPTLERILAGNADRYLRR